MPRSLIQFVVLGRFTMTSSPTENPAVESTLKLVAPTGTYLSMRLRVVPDTVAGEPDVPPALIRFTCEVAVERRTVSLVPSPWPRKITPPARIVT